MDGYFAGFANEDVGANGIWLAFLSNRKISNESRFIGKKWYKWQPEHVRIAMSSGD